MAIRSRKQRPYNNFVWEGFAIGPAEESGHCIKIRATREQLDLVAGWLLGELGYRYPDESEQYETDNPLSNLNQPLMNAARYIGRQLLGDGLPCEEMMMPIFRMNPDNSCQMQQSTDGGTTWTTVMDSSACLPEMIRLRQNPFNPMQVQQSHDGGFTWTLAWTFAPVPAVIMGDRVDIVNSLSLLQQWQTITTVNQIHIDAPTITFNLGVGDDTDRIEARKLALCYAVKVYVNAYLEGIRLLNDGAATAGNLVSLALGVATAVAAIATAGTAGATLPLFLGLGAALTAAGSGAYGAITGAVLDDAAAREAVACCMYLTLKDQTPTAANFAAAVDTCPDLSANAELIRATLANDLDTAANLETQFKAFMNVLGDSLRPAELGLITDCPCEEIEPPATFCKFIDFETDDPDDFGISPNIEAPGISFVGYTWSPGTGLVTSGLTDGDRTFGTADWSAYDITRIVMEYAYVGTGSGNVYADNDFGVNHPTESPLTTLDNDYTAPLTNLIFGGDRPGADVTAFIVIKSLTVYGNGSNPWGSDNC